MVVRAFWGLVGGGALGGLYGVFGRCIQGVCAVDWNPAVPAVGGALLGLGIVLASRWD